MTGAVAVLESGGGVAMVVISLLRRGAFNGSVFCLGIAAGRGGVGLAFALMASSWSESIVITRLSCGLFGIGVSTFDVLGKTSTSDFALAARRRAVFMRGFFF